VNAIGRMDAVIHNAGVYLEPSRAPTTDGHASSLAVNTLAPYLLTALIDRRIGSSTSAADCITPAPGRCGTSTGPGGPGTPHLPGPGR
jgi:NAD(P)-dependent dehydrogenase (short-subunit alcohol dehydrogenase family)